MPNQSFEWRSFYTHTIDLPEVHDIYTEEEDPSQKGWKHLKMMFEGKDQQALQTSLRPAPREQEDPLESPWCHHHYSPSPKHKDYLPGLQL